MAKTQIKEFGKLIGSITNFQALFKSFLWSPFKILSAEEGPKKSDFDSRSFSTLAENFKMVDIEINAWSPGFTKPEIKLIRIQYPRKKFKIQPISVSY